MQSLRFILTWISRHQAIVLTSTMICQPSLGMHYFQNTDLVQSWFRTCPSSTTLIPLWVIKVQPPDFSFAFHFMQVKNQFSNQFSDFGQDPNWGFFETVQELLSLDESFIGTQNLQNGLVRSSLLCQAISSLHRELSLPLLQSSDLFQDNGVESFYGLAI